VRSRKKWSSLFSVCPLLTVKSMCRDNMSHDGFEERCKSLGWGFCAENVHYNSEGKNDMTASAKTAMTGWWESPGHKANILSKDANKGGVGYYVCPNGNTYFTALFG
jgi:uncharacterized protein YkwD